MRLVFTFAALVLVSATAQAGAIFNFSFQNVAGSINGTVSGSVTLSGTGDGTFAATSIIIDSAPAGLGYTTPLNVMSTFSLEAGNVFVVSGGQIVKANSRYSASGAGTINLGFYGVSLLTVASSTNISSGILDATSSTLIYTAAPSAVPEPSTAVGLVAVCGVIGVLRRMRRSA